MPKTKIILRFSVSRLETVMSKIGVMILSGDPFFAEQPTGQFLRLAFSYVTPTKIAEGIEKLGKALVTGC